MSKRRLEQHLQTSKLSPTKALCGEGCRRTNCFASPRFCADLQRGHPTLVTNKKQDLGAPGSALAGENFLQFVFPIEKSAPPTHKIETIIAKGREDHYPAEALHTDVVGVGATGRAVDDAVPQLVIRRVPRHAAKQLAAILHQDWGGRKTRRT